ncbi:MAG TPA: MgtC/SapB family protein [Beijerinckiaceae bacterium]|jgi:putative Mg2+ transporter-C (MgtC) family protein
MYDTLRDLISELRPGPHFAALIFAYLLALPIGWNREKRARSAGLRTFPLVAIASCGFIQAMEVKIAGEAEALARIVEGVIAGMGFIGGGAILRMDDRVVGTATAASLWSTGAIGVAVGVGSYDVAIALSLVTSLTFYGLSFIKTEINETHGIAPPRRGGDGAADNP